MDDSSELHTAVPGLYPALDSGGSPPSLPQHLSSETGMDDSSGSDGSQPSVNADAVRPYEENQGTANSTRVSDIAEVENVHQGIAAEFEELSKAVQSLEDLGDIGSPRGSNNGVMSDEGAQELSGADYILGTGIFQCETEEMMQLVGNGEAQDFSVDASLTVDGKQLFKSSQEPGDDGSGNFSDDLVSCEEKKDGYSADHFTDDMMDFLDEGSHQDSNAGFLSPEFTTEHSSSLTQSPDNSTNDGSRPDQISQPEAKQQISDTSSQGGIENAANDGGSGECSENPSKKSKLDSGGFDMDLSCFKISFNAGLSKLGCREVVFTGDGDPAAEERSALDTSREEGEPKEQDQQNDTEQENELEHEDGELEYNIVDDLEDDAADKDEMADDGEYVAGATDEEDEGAESLTEEIDAMLDEGVSDYKARRKRKRDESEGDDQRDPGAPEGLIGITNKKMLKSRGRASLEPLPEGWVEIAHRTGMPLYLHRASRVVTWARPYFLGVGSARKHKVPLRSVPCLHYKKELEREKTGVVSQDSAVDGGTIEDNAGEATNSNDANENSSQTGEGAATQAGEEKKDEMKSKIEVCKDESVSPEEFESYLESLFEFENISIKRFKSWAARRAHNRDMRRKQATERPTFPGSSNVVTLKLPDNGPTHKGKKEITLNLHGKTNVCLLHEYAQRVLRAHPKYIFNENENANAPFQAVIKINDVKYGSGFAANKKLAKEEAAKSTLEILVPELVAKKQEQKSEPNDLEYFDHIPIEDSRFYDLCHKAGQLTPWQILQECLKRNHGMGDTNVNFDVKVGKNQKSEYTMTCGKHVAKGFCKNKIVGKQLAAQTILQKLHPQIRNWGSLIRMYGKGTCGIEKVKEQEEQSVMELQQHAKKNRPNMHILERLKKEMRKLHSQEQEKKKKVKKFHPGNIEKPSTALCPLDV